MISQLSLRLYPRPGADRTLLWTAESLGEGVKVARSLAGLPFIPAGLELLAGVDPDPGSADPIPEAVVLLRLVGSETGVARVERGARELVGSPDRMLNGEGSRMAAIHRSTQEGGVGPIHRRHTLPALIGGLLEDLAPAGRPVAVHVLSGTIRCLGWTPARGRSGSEAREGSGVAGEAGAALLSRLRKVFDPEGVLPGAWREGWT
jgi:hypothetical protein